MSENVIGNTGPDPSMFLWILGLVAAAAFAPILWRIIFGKRHL